MLCHSCNKPLYKVVVVNSTNTDDWWTLKDEVFVFETSVIEHVEPEVCCGECNEELDDIELSYFDSSRKKDEVK